MKAIRDCPGWSVHASLPCTIWSQWQKLNWSKNPPLQSDLDYHLLMLRHFLEVAEAILASGGQVSFEWPRHCSGWLHEELIAFIHKHRLYKVNVDGCACGLVDNDGRPFLKKWAFITSSERLARSLSGLKCQHSKDYAHAEISGSKTKGTEVYPSKLCHTILSGLFGH